MSRATARKTCTHHCAECGSHFHSLWAFDAHQPGECSLDVVSEKTGQLMLEPWAEEGYCQLADGYNAQRPQHPVTIYTRAGLSQRREALGAMKGRES